MTNFERIKAMSVEEVVKVIKHHGCSVCPLNKDSLCFELGCSKSIKKWLESETADKA